MISVERKLSANFSFINFEDPAPSSATPLAVQPVPRFGILIAENPLENSNHSREKRESGGGKEGERKAGGEGKRKFPPPDV